MATDACVVGILDRLWAMYDQVPRGTAEHVERTIQNAREAWDSHLNGYSDDEVIDACELWVANYAKMPTLIDIGREVQRARVQSRKHAPAIEEGPRPLTEYPVERRRVGTVLGVAQTTAMAQLPKKAEHYHGISLVKDDAGETVGALRGADACPICSRHDVDEAGRHRSDCARCRLVAYETLNAVSVQYRADFEPGFEPETGEGEPKGSALVGCTLCLDLRFREIDGAWRPCTRCSQEAHKRWSEGHLEPGHECAVCSDLRRGVRQKASA